MLENEKLTEFDNTRGPILVPFSLVRFPLVQIFRLISKIRNRADSLHRLAKKVPDQLLVSEIWVLGRF